MCISFWFLVIFSHVNQWQSVKWANKYKILILNSHFRLRKLRSSYQGTKNVANYAFSSGKNSDVRKIAGVKNLTNIMSGNTGRFVECSNTGWLEDWITGRLVNYWNSGYLEACITGKLVKYWNIGLPSRMSCWSHSSNTWRSPSPQSSKSQAGLSIALKKFFLTDHKLRILYIPRFIADSGDPFALPIRKL